MTIRSSVLSMTVFATLAACDQLPMDEASLPSAQGATTVQPTLPVASAQPVCFQPDANGVLHVSGNVQFDGDVGINTAPVSGQGLTVRGERVAGRFDAPNGIALVGLGSGGQEPNMTKNVGGYFSGSTSGGYGIGTGPVSSGMRGESPYEGGTFEGGVVGAVGRGPKTGLSAQGQENSLSVTLGKLSSISTDDELFQSLIEENQRLKQDNAEFKSRLAAIEARIANLP